jgi:hypothetical protein
MPTAEETQHAVEKFREGCALVGEFFCHWSWLEHAMDQAIAKMVGADFLGSFILGQNINTSSKIDILASAASMYGEHQGEQENKAFHKALVRIGELARSHRNVFAHTPFKPTRSGVGFIRSRAKKTLKIEVIKFTRSDLRPLVKEIQSLSEVVTKFADGVAARRATGDIP